MSNGSYWEDNVLTSLAHYFPIYNKLGTAYAHAYANIIINSTTVTLSEKEGNKYITTVTILWQYIDTTTVVKSLTELQYT